MSKGIFEVGVYNREVRQLVEIGASHPMYNDSWADLSWIEIRADDLESAKRRARVKFPEAQGFVVVDIMPQGSTAAAEETAVAQNGRARRGTRVRR